MQFTGWNPKRVSPVYLENVENVMAYHSEGAPEDRTVVSTTKARQAVTGNNVRYVLGFGLAAAAIAFAIVYFIYFG